MEQRRVSAERVAQVWADGDFDGLVGFSQGGALAAHVVRQGLVTPRFCVFFSSYAGLKPSPHTSSSTLPWLITTSSLHVWGSNDQVVRPAFSRALCESMRGSAHCIDDTGHAIPPSPFAETVVADWLQGLV